MRRDGWILICLLGLLAVAMLMLWQQRELESIGLSLQRLRSNLGDVLDTDGADGEEPQ